MNNHFPTLTTETEIFNYNNPSLKGFIQNAGCDKRMGVVEAVARLHDAVRDEIDYSVFNVPLNECLRASDVAEEVSGFCLHKSILFIAGCRYLGVPAILCSDVVTNHVSDDAMIKLVGGEEFLHWYTEIYINGQWIKSAPIFNSLLCELYEIEVIQFDPNGGNISQQNTNATRMLHQGKQRFYANPSMKELIKIIAKHHPRMITESGLTPTSLAMTGQARIN